jgi:hypothetical protein
MFCPMRPTMSRLDTAPANGGSNRLHHRPGKSGITACHVRRDKAAFDVRALPGHTLHLCHSGAAVPVLAGRAAVRGLGREFAEDMPNGIDHELRISSMRSSALL